MIIDESIYKRECFLKHLSYFAQNLPVHQADHRTETENTGSMLFLER